MATLSEKVKAVMPPHERKEDILMVAVLKSQKSASSDRFASEDFLWVKCKRNTTAAKIAQQFDSRRQDNTPWTLTFEGKPATLSSHVGTLDVRGDGLIIFDASGSSQSCHREDRKPPLPLSPNDANVQRSSTPQKSVSAPGHENIAPDTATKPPVPLLPAGQPRQIIPSQGPPAPRRLSPLLPYPQAVAGAQGQTLYAQSSPGPNPHAYLNTLHCRSPKPPSHSASQPSRSSYPEPMNDGYKYPYQSTPGLTIGKTPEPGSQYYQAFQNYCSLSYNNYKSTNESECDEQIHRWILDAWCHLSDKDRELYKTQTLPPDSKRGPVPLTPGSPLPESVPSAQNVTQSTPATAEVSSNYKNSHISRAQLDQQQQNHLQLLSLVKDAKPQELESVVEEGIKLLDDLRAPLLAQMAGTPDSDQWIQQIDNLKKQAVKTKTVIGVVGNTGAGKSSVINAMLDEERLVPTNCMRACTAVVTEISYNTEEKPYVARIEFISRSDWEKELNVLFEDMFDGEGRISRECSNEDSDAGIAYAKIKAVYPSKTREDLANSNVANLLQEVSFILGSYRDIKETDSLMFYRKLQNYVDSKEKATGKKDKDGKKAKKERELWPLIRVVRLYVRSKALATGAVIVDLPGVHDSNQARAAVAQSYIKSCTGLWIVAPITRAVDDKAAKSLLGETFKRQLKMDGGFSAVTFICSKTDDISLMEAQESLGLDEQMLPSWEKVDDLAAEQRRLKQQLDEMKESMAVYEEVANDADEQIEVWEKLEESASGGEVVYTPRPQRPKKRKSGSRQSLPKKKRKTLSSDDDDNYFVVDDDVIEEEDEESDADPSTQDSQQGDPLTMEQIEEKLLDLKKIKKDGRTQKRELNAKMADLRKELMTVKESEKGITAEMSQLCISGRNQYSRGAIQQDFAAGIKELDQEIAGEEDEDNFNPDEDVRDYDEVARSLPVFCVSSRGYQKLQGRLRKDPNIPGFQTIEETEIPQLQAHCEKLTETGRAASCRTFLNKLSQLINSMAMWASNDGSGANLTKEQKEKEAKFLQKGLDALETALEKAISTSCRELKNEFETSIFDKSEAAIQDSVQAAVETTTKWGSKVNRENRAEGGLFWATYKAVCRRDGVYTNAQGLHDWNQQLTDPLLKHLMQGWEKCFGRRLLSVINGFIKNAPAALSKFHQNIEARVWQVGGNNAGLSMLQQQIGVYEQILKDLGNTTKETINTKQKDINREFVPTITKQMVSAYNVCAAERGSGSFARMKTHMNSHIAHERLTMFSNSINHVRNLLKTLVKEAESEMSDKVDEVFMQVKRDFCSVLGGADASQQGEILPRVQRQVRKQVRKLIEGTEKRMKKTLGQEIEESEASDGEDQDEESKGETEAKVEEGAIVPKSEKEDDGQSQLSGRADHSPSGNVVKKENILGATIQDGADCKSDAHRANDSGQAVPPSNTTAADPLPRATVDGVLQTKAEACKGDLLKRTIKEEHEPNSKEMKNFRPTVDHRGSSEMCSEEAENEKGSFHFHTSISSLGSEDEEEETEEEDDDEKPEYDLTDEDRDNEPDSQDS